LFLRRRDEFHRAISHLVAEATQFSDEAQRYQQAISGIPLPPLDERKVQWYIDNVPEIANRLLASIRTNRVMEVWYEDLFGSGVAASERLRRFTEVLEFLEIPPAPHVVGSMALSLLLSPSAKLNDSRTLLRVPNYEQLRQNFTSPNYVPRANATVWLEQPYLEHCTEGIEDLTRRIRAEFASAAEGSGWRLRLDEGNAATVARVSKEPEHLRISMIRTAGPPYNVQLNFPIGPTQADRKYVLTFRARADSERTIGIGVAQQATPWANLGYYEEILLTAEWHEFRREMTLQSDSSARVHVDLAGNDATVELAGFSLSPV
jgi:hypothetical protein